MPFFVGKAQALAADAALRAGGRRFFQRFRQVQQAEYLAAGRHAVHRHMEIRAQGAQGQEKIGRKQNDGKAPGKAGAPGCKFPCGHNNAQRGAAIRNDVHDDDRIQLHRQHLHGNAPKMLGIAVHLPVAVFIRAVYLQSGKALQVFQKVVAQRGVLPPVPAQKALCKFLHRHDGHRNERHAHHQNHGRAHAYRAQHRKQRNGRQHTVKKLGQIGAEIGLKLFRALARKLHHLGGGHALRIGRPQAKQLAVDKPAQCFFHFLRSIKGRARRPFCAGKAHRGRGGHYGRRAPEHTRLCAAPKQGLQKQPQREYHGNIGGKRAPLKRHVLHNIPFAARHNAKQPFIQHLLSPSFWPAARSRT